VFFENRRGNPVQIRQNSQQLPAADGIARPEVLRSSLEPRAERVASKRLHARRVRQRLALSRQKKAVFVLDVARAIAFGLRGRRRRLPSRGAA
jgi:hypothetical protein